MPEQHHQDQGTQRHLREEIASERDANIGIETRTPQKNKIFL
jgi:hypothetical protein